MQIECERSAFFLRGDVVKEWRPPLVCLKVSGKHGGADVTTRPVVNSRKHVDSVQRATP